MTTKPDPIELIRAVQAKRQATGLTVRYLSPYTGEEVSCTRRDAADLADFCRRIEAAGGKILARG